MAEDSTDSCLSTIQMYEVHYTWVIEHFSFCFTKGEDLWSLTFTSPRHSDCKWFLKLISNNALGQIGLSLKLDNSSVCKKVYAKFKFSILDAEQKEQFVRREKIRKFEITDDEKTSTWGPCEFIKKKVLFGETLLPNDKLRIGCEIQYSAVDVFTGAVNESSSKETNPLQPVTEYNLSEDLEELQRTSPFTDVVLSVNGKEFPAHKCILAARSPVFAAMFKHDMQESQNNRVEIVDSDEDLVEEMLHYIYTGKCKNLDKLADRSLEIADKYDLPGLKILCQEFLLKSLTVENAADMLSLAHLRGAQELKYQTISFISKNSAEVMDSAVWKNIAPKFPPELIIEVCQALSRRLKHER